MEEVYNDAFNITDLFFNTAKKYPNKTAVIFKNKNISFSELEVQIENTAQYFLNKGIGKNDRVLVFVPMSIDLYRIVLALFKIGAIAVFLDEWVNKNRMEECCKIAICKAIISTLKARIFIFFSKELKKIPIRLGVGFNEKDPRKNLHETYYDDIALITFTTGSTGIPKASIRTHRLLYNQFIALEEKLEYRDDDISMTVLPIVLLINLAVGTTSVIADFKSSKPDSLLPEKIIRQLKKYSVNTIIGSPFFIKKLSEYIIQEKKFLPQIKKIFTGGAPVFPSEAKIYNKAFPETKIEIIYGSTEAEPISSISANDLVNLKNDILNGLNVGKVSAYAEVKIIKIDDKNIFINSEKDLTEIVLPHNTIGEIIVKGKHVLRDYLNNEEAFKRNKILVGNEFWHRTGDSGYITESGNLFLMGRCNSLIVKNQKIFYPFVYENYFQLNEYIEIGTVIKITNKVSAVVQLRDKSKESLVKDLIKEVEPLIEQIIFIKKIPRDPRHNSKIDYQKLSNLLEKEVFIPLNT